jgi:hypothetical protein
MHQKIPTPRRGGNLGWLFIFALLFVLGLSSGALASSPHSQSTPASMVLSLEETEQLTQSLTALSARYRREAAAAQTKLRQEMRDLVAARRQQLTELMEQNPGEVLRMTLPGPLRAQMPADIQEYLEEEVELEGEVNVFVEDYGHTDRIRYFLETAAERLSLHFATRPPQLQSGTRLRLKGVKVDSALALESGDASIVIEKKMEALPNTFDEQRTLVLLVNFQDNPSQPYSLDHARRVVFESTSDFFLENSDQRTWLSGDVYGWYTLPLHSTSCNFQNIGSHARQAAAAAGVDLSLYRRYVYAFPRNACGWWGLASVGGNPSQAWINGSLQLQVVGHELGHNFGLYHARALDCGQATLGSHCNVLEYGDTLDIMGNSTAHFSPFGKERLGWLEDAIKTVTQDGTYLLEPYQAPPGSDPKALKILRSVNPNTGRRTWYYVEYRQALGFDSFLANNSNVLNGVIVRVGSEGNGQDTYLLDMAPNTASWRYPALVINETFHDPEAGVTITPLWADGHTAAVNVSLGPLACTLTQPRLALAPSQSQWVSPGTAVTYTVSVTNNDDPACAAASFHLQADPSAGWEAVFTQPVLTLEPGASITTTLTVTSPAAAEDGFYPVAVATHGSDENLSASASITQVLASDSALAVTVSTPRPSYTSNQWIFLMAQVNSGGVPVANANVTFTMTPPLGRAFSETTTSRENGTAVIRFRLGHTAPPGVYQVQAEARFDNGLSESGTTSFVFRRI